MLIICVICFTSLLFIVVISRLNYLLTDYMNARENNTSFVRCVLPFVLRHGV